MHIILSILIVLLLIINTIYGQSVPDRNYDNTDIGPCICDLTYNYCDANCACDNDCSIDRINRFSADLPSGPKPVTVYKCTDSQLIDINQRGGVTTQLLNNVLCVVTDNNPSKGKYFHPPEPGKAYNTRLQFNQLVSTSEAGMYNYDDTAQFIPTVDTGDTFYKVNDYIKGSYIVAAILNKFGNGYLSLIGPDVNNNCNNNYHPRYSNSTSYTCARYTPALAADCATALFDANNIADTNIYASKLKAADFTQQATFVQLQIGNVNKFDPATGLTIPAAITPPTFAAGTCSNVVKSVVYNITTIAAGEISGLSVDIVLTDIQATTSGAGFIEQSYQVVFREGDSASLAPAIAKSGNPGYLVGKPVLIGTVNTANQIDQQIGGIYLLGKSATVPGLCGNAVKQLLTFGEDIVTSCSVQINDVNAFVSFCGSNKHFFDYLNYTEFRSKHMGKWGNSHFAAIDDWLPIQPSEEPFSDPISSQPTTSSAVCENIINTVGLEIITAEFGSFNNPQYGIINARLTHKTTTITYPRRPNTAPVPEYYPISFTVKWIFIDNSGVNEFIPSAPPLLPNVPDDLLYPLFIPGFANMQYNMNSIIILSVSLISLLLQLLM